MQSGDYADHRRSAVQLQGDLRGVQLEGQSGRAAEGRHARQSIHLSNRSRSRGRARGAVDGLREQRILRASVHPGGSERRGKVARTTVFRNLRTRCTYTLYGSIPGVEVRAGDGEASGAGSHGSSDHLDTRLRRRDGSEDDRLALGAARERGAEGTLPAVSQEQEVLQHGGAGSAIREEAEATARSDQRTAGIQADDLGQHAGVRST